MLFELILIECVYTRTRSETRSVLRNGWMNEFWKWDGCTRPRRNFFSDTKYDVSSRDSMKI